MTTIGEKDSERFIAALRAIKHLVLEEGVPAASTAFNRAVANEELKDFITKNGLEPYMGPSCYARLLGKGECKAELPEGCLCHPFAEEGYSLWLKNGKPYLFVFHPYALEDEALQELVLLGDREGWKIRVSTRPYWQWPGAALTVEVIVGEA